MSPAELARLQAIEDAAREYVEWVAVKPKDAFEEYLWVARAADLRRILADALAVKP